ncbi:putative pyridoxal biosynthesis protein PDX1 [Platanthera guangdongensis]|uniref:Pyridoxal biosynthesis protein PDX1 n=1 Tax=Platanthera guangdongensis TaxID=2320717 RepID=A0ABR2MPE0_9ASPA
MIRTKGEADTDNIVEAVRHVRSFMGDICLLRNMDDNEVFSFAQKIAAPYCEALFFTFFYESF